MTTEAIEYVDGLSAEVKDRLERPLDRQLVSHNDFNSRKPEFEYLKHDVIIRQANDIFGYDGWGYEIVGGVDLNTSGNKQFYRTMVRVTVVGAPSRMGIGSWHVAADNPASHDTAMAGAVTLALKRALRPFGAQFGLGLEVRGRFGSSGRGGGHRQTNGHRGQSRSAQAGSGHSGNAPRSPQPSGPDTQTPANPSRQPSRDVPDLFADESDGGGAASQIQRIDLPRVKRWLDGHGIDLDVCNRMLGIKHFATPDMKDYMDKNGLSTTEALIARLDGMVQAQLAGMT